MKLRGRFLMLAGIGLSAIISVTGCGSEPQQDTLPAGSTVVALGDSLTYGYGANPKTAYPTVLAELSKWNVVNAGVNGDTSADVLTRVNEIIEQNPDLVLLGVGGNDVLQRIAPDTTRANIVATIDTLQSNNIDVVLIAEPYLSTSALFGKASDNPLYEDIAEAEGIPLYSDGWSTVLSDEALKSDKIHANAAGYRQFAEGLHDYLKDEGWVH
ncbi:MULTISPECIES: GDSL-type esterase/lipase family protein [Psychrobacter]|jgi:acyl-CoA thioesterase-1|uniref:GDSL-type esterase/lipase family protein n=1 Tax=Psychrobacter TaxID=497 RepID=UPI00086C3BE6|nr:MULTISPECIES: GDSL-type esterase/lipase family protein [Psychrobacter]MBA6244306.1 arylesterase [Psychrobacter sp. Urea-trap-18]MBA6286313.1 arylesterase [Psychrobacter sp. Urea-trap-16]MBA6317720.1 arylesterase [Psychrobacter sp. Urea-trap-20]MBA6335387.1 arylesterase [Psychrobacter sp. Urea-trap-19]OEH68729.1 MAG: arylesterase [Psychrobacter sp. B29-1]|tara:strand:+ start:9339 stop:9977 length:639 start_codon:yes stop_codon:yes gene_type:complete